MAMPRRDRLLQIAQALEVSLGELLVSSGWLSFEESQRLDLPGDGLVDGLADDWILDIQRIREKVEELRRALETASRMLEETDRSLAALARANPPERGNIHAPAGVFDSWENTAVFND